MSHEVEAFLVVVQISGKEQKLSPVAVSIMQ
jgi:hypothetical protein